MRCGIAKLDGELTAVKCQRRGPEWAALESYVASPDFARRAAEVKEEVLATMARCEPINVGDVARALGLPLDAAAVWLTTEIALPLGEDVRLTVVDGAKERLQ